jgi:hypothetical protein
VGVAIVRLVVAQMADRSGCRGGKVYPAAERAFCYARMEQRGRTVAVSKG